MILITTQWKSYWAALSLSFRLISMFMNIKAWGPQVMEKRQSGRVKNKHAQSSLKKNLQELAKLISKFKVVLIEVYFQVYF